MKRVYDVTASELDFIRLTERLGTEERMTDMSPATQLEMDLRLSMFRQGFAWGVRESVGGFVEVRLMERHQAAMSDADYACGYSMGSSVAEQALQNYRAALEGR